jgi:hypothetical protein
MCFLGGWNGEDLNVDAMWLLDVTVTPAVWTVLDPAPMDSNIAPRSGADFKFTEIDGHTIGLLFGVKYK